MPRIVRIATPLGESLRFRTVRGEERLSQLFEYQVGLIADSPDLDGQTDCTFPLSRVGTAGNHGIQ